MDCGGDKILSRALWKSAFIMSHDNYPSRRQVSTGVRKLRRVNAVSVPGSAGSGHNPT